MIDTEIPNPNPEPAHGWTPERKALFLDRLAAHGNARAACRNVGLSAEAAYKLRRRDPLFARAWAAAVVLGRDASIQALAERAIEGVEEEIYYRGELIGTRRRYDSRLLLAHLARLDRLADEQGAGEDAGRLDEIIAAIAADAPFEPMSGRCEAIEAAARAAEREYSEFEIEMGLAEDPEYTLDEAEDARDDVRADARKQAGEGWDAGRRQLFANVDTLCDASSPSLDPKMTGPSPLLAALMIERPLKQACEAGNAAESTAAFSFPCTLSTASTSALARGLAGPERNYAATPTSPFTAPRRMAM